MTDPSRLCCSPTITDSVTGQGNVLFLLGEVRVTPGAEAILTPLEMVEALRRHQSGDYGISSDEDAYQNHRALANDGMVMSVFHSAEGIPYWVQTHGSRSHTLILLPGE